MPLLSHPAQALGTATEEEWGLMFLRHEKTLDERPHVSIKYHHEAGGFYFSLLIVLLTVHTVSLTFLTTLLAPNKKGWAGTGGKRGGGREPYSPPDLDFTPIWRIALKSSLPVRSNNATSEIYVNSLNCKMQVAFLSTWEQSSPETRAWKRSQGTWLSIPWESNSFCGLWGLSK